MGNIEVKESNGSSQVFNDGKPTLKQQKAGRKNSRKDLRQAIEKHNSLLSLWYMLMKHKLGSSVTINILAVGVYLSHRI